jgi:hypothetical protein
MPVISKPSVPEVKDSHRSRKLGGSKERPGPPDLSREVHDGFGAGIDFALTGNDAHLAQQLIGRPSEKGGHAGILQRGEAEAALLEGAAESARERSTNDAIAVEADPASRCVPAFCVSQF